MAQEKVLSYAEVLKAPARKLIKTAQVTIIAHEIKEFAKAQKQAFDVDLITRKYRTDGGVKRECVRHGVVLQ